MTMVNKKDSMKPPLPGPRYFNPFWLVRSLLNPTDFMLRTRERYGDTYRLPTVLGPAVVTGDPEGVRAIFSADADTFVPFQPHVKSTYLTSTYVVLQLHDLDVAASSRLVGHDALTRARHVSRTVSNPIADFQLNRLAPVAVGRS